MHYIHYTIFHPEPDTLTLDTLVLRGAWSLFLVESCNMQSREAIHVFIHQAVFQIDYRSGKCSERSASQYCVSSGDSRKKKPLMSLSRPISPCIILRTNPPCTDEQDAITRRGTNTHVRIVPRSILCDWEAVCWRVLP